MFPDFHLWNYRHQFSGNNVFQCYMSCNDHFALLFSFTELWSGLQVLEWNVPETTWPSDGARRMPVPAPASCHCRVHRSHLLPGTNTGKTMPVAEASIPCLPAGTSRRGQGRRKQIKGEAEQLVTRSWQLSPGFPAQPLQQSSLSGPSSAHSRMGGSCSCICKCQDGKAGWGISICNATRPQGKSRHNGQQLAMVFFLKEKVLAPGQRSEPSAGLRKGLW